MPQSAKRAEVLVIGGGLGGLVAASRAAELGSEVMLLDKGDPLAAGNTLTTTGIYFTAGIAYNSSPDELYTRAMRFGAANPETARAWADNCQRALLWLEAIGMKIEKPLEGPPRLESTSSISEGPVYMRDVGAKVVTRLRDFFQAHQGVSSPATKAVKLLRRKGRVTGVEAIAGEGRRITIESAATIIATGGFQANRELVRKYVGPSADRCKLMGSVAATGDGLKLAIKLGARLVNLGYIYGKMMPIKALTDDQFWPYPTLDMLIEDGIIVNRAGRRFCDEGWGDNAVANLVSKWKDVTCAYLIFDGAAWERSRHDTLSIVPPNPWLLEKGGNIHEAEGLLELAEQLGIDGRNLEATVGQFNAVAARRRLGELDIPRINHPPPLKPPFYGVRLVPGIISTLGGPLVNMRMNVMSRKGKAIPGLYAAGDVIGGLMGGKLGGYVGGISQAVVSGLLSGESAHRVVGKLALT